VPSLAHIVGLDAALERAEERTYDAVVEIIDSEEVDHAVRDVVNSVFSRMNNELGEKSWKQNIGYVITRLRKAPQSKPGRKRCLVILQIKSVRKKAISQYCQIAMVLAKYRLEEVLKYVGIKNYALVGWMLRGNPFRKNGLYQTRTYPYGNRGIRHNFREIGTNTFNPCRPAAPGIYARAIETAKFFETASVDIMKKVISDDLGKPADEIFSQFTPEPVGVASIGQVYACTITDGPEVVVKVQKPGVPELVEEDMYILGGAAVSATKHWEGAQQYDLVGIVQEILTRLRQKWIIFRKP